MTGYRVPADSAAEVDHVVDQELLAVAMAEAGQLEAFAAVEAFEAYDSPGALAPPTAPNPSTPVHASELDAAQGWAAREAEGLDATAAGDSGRSVSGVVIEDLPDIPEVPFSVRVASMWGAAMPAPSRPAEDEADEAGFGQHFADLEEDPRYAVRPHRPVGQEHPGPVVLDEAQAWQRLLRLMERHPGRLILGVSGEPGAGKTTYAEYLAACCVDAVVVGLDGFQLSSGAQKRMGRAARGGAPDTFDVEGYLALLRRLRRDDERTVWAPEYRRDLEEPVAGVVAVRPSTRVVVTEGNYLLLPQRHGLEARALCHEVWYVEVPDHVRVERLVGRHRRYGRSKAQARARVTVGVDAENAHVVAGTRDRADVVVRLSVAHEEYC